jgi:hypothetical protein
MKFVFYLFRTILPLNFGSILQQVQQAKKYLSYKKVLIFYYHPVAKRGGAEISYGEYVL